MTDAIFEITKAATFDAAHYIEQGEPDHRYRRLHGHSFRVEASVRGAVPTAAEVWHTLARSSAVVGMHPDGATEAIIDFALATGKPFAVVPCCVYSASFPTRRDRRGRRVTSYRHFVDYLLEKAPGRIGLATLPFEGKNLVVYSLPPLPVSPPAAAADDTTADDAAEAVGDTVACVPCE